MNKDIIVKIAGAATAVAVGIGTAYLGTGGFTWNYDSASEPVAVQGSNTSYENKGTKEDLDEYKDKTPKSDIDIDRDSQDDSTDSEKKSEEKKKDTDTSDKKSDIKDKNPDIKDKNSEIKDKDSDIKDKNSDIKDKDSDIKDNDNDTSDKEQDPDSKDKEDNPLNKQPQKDGEEGSGLIPDPRFQWGDGDNSFTPDTKFPWNDGNGDSDSGIKFPWNDGNGDSDSDIKFPWNDGNGDSDSGIKFPWNNENGDFDFGKIGGGFPFGDGSMENNVEIAEEPSEIIKSKMTNTAKSLTEDISNAIEIKMSDSNNDVKISESGTYIISGACSDGNITVKKETVGVVLILKDLKLTSTKGACLSLNKASEVKLVIEGNVKLIDSENPEDEKSQDTEISDAFDGAAIKIKAGANVYITGSGNLEIDASACKNGIKASDDPATSVTIDGPSINIVSANDAINSGYDLNILSGNLTIKAGDDAIHAERILTIGSEDGQGPVINITESQEGLEGSVVNVFGGDITLNAASDGVNAANSNGTYLNEMAYSINIMGGTLNVTCSRGDGLDSNGNVNLIAGKLTIKSMYNVGEAGIDYDGTYYVSENIEIDNSSGVSGPDNFGGGMGGRRGKIQKPAN